MSMLFQHNIHTANSNQFSDLTRYVVTNLCFSDINFLRLEVAKILYLTGFLIQRYRKMNAKIKDLQITLKKKKIIMESKIKQLIKFV